MSEFLFRDGGVGVAEKFRVKVPLVVKNIVFKIGVALGVTDLGDYPIPDYPIQKYTPPQPEDAPDSFPEVVPTSHSSR